MPPVIPKPQDTGQRQSRLTLLRGVGWLFLAQALGRVARLATTLTVARVLAPEHFGIAAVALATSEFAAVVARYATTPAIVSCEGDVLEERCRAAWRLNWHIGFSLFAIQCALAIPIALWYESPTLIGSIWTLALVYLLLPFGAVHVARTLRRQDLQSVARGEVLQAVGDMLLTVALALAGAGVWALIIPKAAVVPLWIWTHRRASPWTPQPAETNTSRRAMLAYGRRVMGVEVLTVVRQNIDYLLVGAVLGVQALGIYFFAFNAGLGIARGISSALSGALFPNLCDGDRRLAAVNARFRDGLKLTTLVVLSWVALQVWAAPYYVPLIFGERWVEMGAVPILRLVCLAAIPIAFVEAGAQYLRARDLPQRDLRWHLPFTVLFAAAIGIGLGGGLGGVAAAVLAAHLINLPLYYLFNILPAMRDSCGTPHVALGEEPRHA